MLETPRIDSNFVPFPPTCLRRDKLKTIQPDLLRVIPPPAKPRRFMALALASLIAPSVLFAAYASVKYDASFRAAETRAIQLTSILQDHAQRVFETIGLALANVDQRVAGLSSQVIRDSEIIWHDLKRIQAAGPQLGSIFVIAADGSVPVTTREFPAPLQDFSDRDYFMAHQGQDAGLYLGRAYVGKISAAPIFNFSIRRSSRDGRFDGVVGVSAYVDYFRVFYATVGDVAEDFNVLLLRTDGEILTSYPNFAVGEKFDPGLLAPAEKGRVHYVESVSDGQSRLFVSAKIANYPALVAYSVTRGSILRRWLGSLVTPGLVTVAVSTVLLLLTSFAFRRARSEENALDHLYETAAHLNVEIERRQLAEASLLQSQKLDAVGQLTGGIAHDFNNLLMIILGNLELAQRREEMSQVRRLLKSAMSAAERGAGLTRQLLTFSRRQSLRPVVVDLNNLLADARVWMARVVSEAIDLQFHHDLDISPVYVDIGQFEAALLNLVVNARDAMNGRGTLTVGAHNTLLSENDPRRQSLDPGPYVAVSVTDDGNGMTAEVLRKVFEPFFTTKDVGKGTGLGLSQVHGFIRQSGGEVYIESEVSKGTTVTLYLPRSHLTPVEVAQPQSVLALTEVQKEKVVLVVEDDDDVRMVSLTMLHDLGYRPIVARTAREAMAILAGGERVDILFSDVILPRGMDGPGLIKEALGLRPSLSVLLTTASIEFGSTFPVLKKPFSKDSLAAAVSAIV